MGPVTTLRKALGITQDEFGRRVGVSQSHISSIEDGHPLSRRLALRIYDEFKFELFRLGISLEDLLRWGDSDGAAA